MIPSELNLRAWDRKAKCIVNIDGMSNRGKTCEVFKGAGLETYFIEYDMLDILRPTGRKDVNGLDIYEGDIVKLVIIGSFSFMELPLFEVVYNNRCAGFELRPTDSKWHKESLYARRQKTYQLNSGTIELIGSKYEISTN